MKIPPVVIASAAGLALAAAASAHHSYGMFDSTREVTLVGTVKEFQWTNPHVWVQILVPNTAGGTTEWSIEGAGLNTLKRQGWTRNSLQPGEKVTAIIHPMRNGENGGSVVRFFMPDGRILGEPLPNPAS